MTTPSGEAGRAAQIPGPMLRMPEGTTVHATVANKLKMKATVYGLNTHPGDAKTGVEIPAGENREFSFAAGAPGTYYYWARTTEPLSVKLVQPLRADAHLNGAFIVDPAGPVAADRVFVINLMAVASDIVHPSFEVVTINGKSYPYTEPFTDQAREHLCDRVDPLNYRCRGLFFGPPARSRAGAPNGRVEGCGSFAVLSSHPFARLTG